MSLSRQVIDAIDRCCEPGRGVRHRVINISVRSGPTFIAVLISGAESVVIRRSPPETRGLSAERLSIIHRLPSSPAVKRVNVDGKPRQNSLGSTAR